MTCFYVVTILSIPILLHSLCLLGLAKVSVAFFFSFSLTMTACWISDKTVEQRDRYPLRSSFITLYDEVLYLPSLLCLSMCYSSAPPPPPPNPEKNKIETCGEGGAAWLCDSDEVLLHICTVSGRWPGFRNNIASLIRPNHHHHQSGFLCAPLLPQYYTLRFCNFARDGQQSCPRRLAQV